MRRPLLVLLAAGLLAGPVVPAAATARDGACDILQLETLVTEFPAKPATVLAGRPLPMQVRITRAGQPAAGVDVFAALTGRSFDALGRGVTGADGVARLVLKVPPDARGAAALDIEAYRTVVDLPCAQVEEYDRNERAWGKVVPGR